MIARDKMGEGRAAATLAMQGVQEAISRWREAPDTEKGPRALDVLSHVGSLEGMKLDEFVDEETARQIKADYKSGNE